MSISLCYFTFVTSIVTHVTPRRAELLWDFSTKLIFLYRNLFCSENFRILNIRPRACLQRGHAIVLIYITRSVTAGCSYHAVVSLWNHDDVIKWKHFPRYWPFMRGNQRSPVNLPHKGQWRGSLKFSLICVWINCWVNNREAGDLRRYRAHYDVTVC